MKRTQTRCVIAVLLVCATFALSATAVPAVVLTNKGQIADGSLSGLGPVMRLLRPADVPFVGPDAQFDVPISSILQITLDFPRMIVETATRTLIGPFSAFSGIAEVLRLDRAGSGPVDLPTTSLRAIALNGSALRPVPREWIQTGFLTKPEVVPGSRRIDAGCDDCGIDLPVFDALDAPETPIYTLTPTLQPEAGGSELPWWVGLLGLAGLLGVFYLVSTEI